MSRKRWMPDRMLACGAGAFLGWIASEILASLTRADGRWFDLAMTSGVVASAIGIAIILVDRSGKPPVERVFTAFVIGGFAGSISGSLGSLLALIFRGSGMIGWALLGLGLGSVEGLYERSPTKLRIGLAGGLVGGLVGGFLFEGAYWVLSTWSIAASRAIGFALFGLSLGRLLEWADAILCPAWLMVIEGARTGQRLILSGSPAILGRAEHATLAFPSAGNHMVDLEHARIIRIANGRFMLEDNQSRHGTSVNRTRVLDPVELTHGALIRIGPNTLRFHERGRTTDPPSEPLKPTVVTPPPPPPPPPAPGTTRCPSCGKLVAGARPYCVLCDLAL